jgi:hypothetical protein
MEARRGTTTAELFALSENVRYIGYAYFLPALSMNKDKFAPRFTVESASLFILHFPLDGETSEMCVCHFCPLSQALLTSRMLF